jgi:hypothetical protein
VLVWDWVVAVVVLDHLWRFPPSHASVAYSLPGAYGRICHIPWLAFRRVIMCRCMYGCMNEKERKRV